MARLILYYHSRAPWDVPTDTVVYLDRHFLTEQDGAEDLSISRRPNAPCLLHRHDDWWLDNHATAHNAHVAVHTPGGHGRLVVPKRCSFQLGDGTTEVWAWDSRYRLRLVVSGSTYRPPATSQDGLRTQVGEPGADERVTELFRAAPIHRAVLAAHYRSYLIPGLEQPEPQGRAQTLRCMGHKTATQLDRALRETMHA